MPAAMPASSATSAEGGRRCMVAETVERWDGLDVLVNNAHGFGVRAPLEEIPDERRSLLDERRQGDVVGDAARPHRGARPRAHVNMVSLAADRGRCRSRVQRAKAGIAALTRPRRASGDGRASRRTRSPRAWTKRGQDYAARDPEGFAGRWPRDRSDASATRRPTSRPSRSSSRATSRSSRRARSLRGRRPTSDDGAEQPFGFSPSPRAGPGRRVPDVWGLRSLPRPARASRRGFTRSRSTRTEDGRGPSDPRARWRDPRALRSSRPETAQEAIDAGSPEGRSASLASAWAGSTLLAGAVRGLSACAPFYGMVTRPGSTRR